MCNEIVILCTIESKSLLSWLRISQFLLLHNLQCNQSHLACLYHIILPASYYIQLCFFFFIFAYLILNFFSLVMFSVIPQTCRYKSKKYECGLSISCVLSGGQPMDLCSGGMIWSCCVDKASPSQDHDSESSPQTGSLNNASK